MRLGEEGWGQAGGGGTCQRIDSGLSGEGKSLPGGEWGWGTKPQGSDGQARPHSTGLSGGP